MNAATILSGGRLSPSAHVKRNQIMRNLGDITTRDEIIVRLRRVRPDSQRLWGKMNAHQMICHLTDAFRGVMGEKEVEPTGTLFHRLIVKHMVLNLPPMPVRNYPTSPEIDQEIGGTTPTEFEADMRGLMNIILQFTNETIVSEKWSHPIFGKLTRRQWSRWAYLHVNHHLRQFGK